MGRKNILKSFKMISDGDMSGNIVSSITNVITLDQASILLEWTGSAVDGEFFVDARNGEKGTWNALDFNTSMLAEADTDHHRIVFTSMPFTDIRVRYVRTAGTGTLNATITMKTIGA
jgi:hypothetical protein